MVREVFQGPRLNTQILECLGLWIYLLIDEFSFNIIRRYLRPPDEFVVRLCHWRQYALGKIDMSAVLDDLSIDKVSYFGH